MARMPHNTHELITAQDFVQQLGRELGDHHPAFRYLEYSILIRRPDLPIGLRDRVDADWVWSLNYPFHMLSRWAKAHEVHPVCWIKRDEICHIRLATSEIFGYRPARMDREFADIGRSWKAAYGAMVDDGSLRLDSPPDLGEYWFGMLVWRIASAEEQERLPTPILPQFAWTPLYRYTDIFRVSTMLSSEVTAASPFGDRPIREIRDEVSRLRTKYGIRLSKLPRTYRGSKTAEFRRHRRDILQRLRDDGYSIVRVVNEFRHWSSLGSEIRDMMVCAGSQTSDAEVTRRISRQMHTPDLVVRMVQSLLDRYPAEEIDAHVFGRDERTLRRDWKSLNR